MREINIGFAFGCLGKKTLQNVTLLDTLSKIGQGTIIGAIRVAQTTGVGYANVESFAAKYPAIGTCDFDAPAGHHKCIP